MGAIVVGMVARAPTTGDDIDLVAPSGGACGSPQPAWVEVEGMPTDRGSAPDWDEASAAGGIVVPTSARPGGSDAGNEPRNTAFRVHIESGVLQLRYPDDIAPDGFLAPSTVGDLDGDGLGEVLVPVRFGDQAGAYLVDGRVGPGSLLVSEIGVRLPWANPGVPFVGFSVVGEQDGVPGVEVAVFEPDGDVVVVSGADLMAQPAGGVVDEWPEPIVTLGGPVVAVLDLGDEHPAVLAHSGRSGELELVQVGAGTRRLSTSSAIVDGYSPDGWFDALWGAVSLESYDSERLLVVDYTMRNNWVLIAWNLDDPCGQFASSAAGADPVSADPLTTG